MSTLGVNQSSIEVTINLFTHLIHDVCSRVGGVKAVDVAMDVLNITARLTDEGLPFAVRVLPTFGKALRSAFQTGRLMAPTSFSKYYSKKLGATALPQLFHGLTTQLFEHDGTLKDKNDRNPDAAWALEQICFLYSKIEYAYSTDQVLKKVGDFKKAAAKRPEFGHNLSLGARTVLADAALLVNEMLEGVDLGVISPKHGPGSTANGRLTPNEKFDEILMSSLPEGYPKQLYGSYSSYEIVDQGDLELHYAGWRGKEFVPATPFSDELLARQANSYERMSTMHTVPKDYKGPRVIMAEPVQQMWVQQGQRRLLEESAKRYSRGRINFRDQSVNKKLALTASSSGYWATLDQSSASDNVSVGLVECLFGGLPKVLCYLLASRSQFAKIPWSQLLDDKDQEDEIIPLGMFAPMGSAVCFPVESIVFWVLAVSALRYVSQSAGHFSPDDWSKRSVYVYGDDVICPAEYADPLMDILREYGLVFGQEKCFTKGPFRESCGCNAFDGVDITAIQIKKQLPANRDDVDRVEAWFEYANAFARNWCWDTSAYIERELRRVLRRNPKDTEKFPIGWVNSPFLAFWSYSCRQSVTTKRPSPDRRCEEEWLQRYSWFEDSVVRRANHAREYNYCSPTFKAYGIKARKVPYASYSDEAGLFEWLTMRAVRDEPNDNVYRNWEDGVGLDAYNRVNGDLTRVISRRVSWRTPHHALSC